MAFAKRKIPTYSGQSGDFPEFQKVWRMVDAEYDAAQSFNFLKSDMLPSFLKDKVKICSDLKSAWLKLEEEYCQANIVALSVVDGLAKINFKASEDHENFQALYDACKHCQADLKEISRESCLQRAIKDVVQKMPKPIRERNLLQP